MYMYVNVCNMHVDYVCISMYVHACACVCVCVSVRVCMCARIHACMHACMHACVYVGGCQNYGSFLGP